MTTPTLRPWAALFAAALIVAGLVVNETASGDVRLLVGFGVLLGLMLVV